MFKAGEWFTLPGSAEPYQVKSVENFIVTFEDERGMDVFAPVDYLTKVPSPFPKLEKMMNRPSVFEAPAEVQEVLDRADQLIHPTPKLEGDWEWLHSMEEDLYEMSFEVMLKHKDHREEILRKLMEVVALEIPRW